MKKIYVIIVTYNGMQWIEKVLMSLNNSDYPMLPVIIDNGSVDGTQDYVKQFYPRVDFIQSDKNLGFGAANNLGIKLALDKNADFIFLLNQDAYIFKGSISSALDILSENKNVGIVSPVHYAGNEIDLDFGFYTYIDPKKTPSLIGDLMSKNFKRKFYETEFINAAAWIGRAEVFETLGGFHPVFAHYGEDIEYTIRLKRNNYLLCIDPKFSIVHDRPQNRGNNAYFKGYLSLERYTLVQYFRDRKANYPKMVVSYLKVFFEYLVKLDINGAFRTVGSFFKTFKSVKNLGSSNTIDKSFI